MGDVQGQQVNLLEANNNVMGVSKNEPISMNIFFRETNDYHPMDLGVHYFLVRFT